jgi:hypothetical protein
MLETFYLIEVWNEDDDIGGKNGVFISTKEYKELPTETEILETLDKYNCEYAEIVKRYKQIK